MLFLFIFSLLKFGPFVLSPIKVWIHHFDRTDIALAQSVSLSDRLSALLPHPNGRLTVCAECRRRIMHDRFVVVCTQVIAVQHMGDLVQEQLKDVLDAYASQDVKAALDVWERDDAIDALYNSLFRELLTYMMEDPRNISFCTHLLFCAKNLERIGDHATNIAENAYYVITGKQLPINRPKSDETLAPAALV